MTANESRPDLDDGAALYESNLDTHDTARDGLPDRRTRVGQYKPHGPIPTNARLLLSGLLWADTATVARAAQLVHPDDLDEPHRTIYTAVVTCARSGLTGPRPVLDRIMRDGQASQPVRDELVHATTAGGIAEVVPNYCAAVLAERFRAACESYGTGIVGWAADGSEAELWRSITGHGAALRKLADRLTEARGGEL